MTSIPEWHPAILPLEPLTDERELLRHGIDRVLAAPAEEEPGMEHDHLRSAGGRDPGAPIERAERGRPFPPARLEMADPAEERRMNGERDVVLTRENAEPLRPRVVHPEPRLEVDLTGVVSALGEQLDRALRALAIGDARRPDPDRAHRATLTDAALSPANR